MSFHQLKLQKDALHSMHNIPAGSNEASLPLQITTDPSESAFNRANLIEEDEIVNKYESVDLSELESGEESWTTMSEIDSQYTRSNNSVRLSSLELSKISDSEDSDDEDEDEGRAGSRVSRIQNQRLLPSLGIISTPTGMMGNKGFTDHFPQHNTISVGTMIGGARLISPRESDFASQPKDRSFTDEHDRVKEAEAQVIQAREELSKVTKRLEELQEQHEIKVRDLQEELAAMKQKEQEQTSSRSEIRDDAGQKIVQEENAQVQQTASKVDNNAHVVAVVDERYEDELDVAQKNKEVAESKLENAIKRLRMVEAKNQKLAEESRKLQTKLESTIKKVRFAEDEKSNLEYCIDEYRTKWEDSMEHAELVEAKLVATQSNLENAERKVEVIMESCEMAITNATNEAAKERSRREEHAKKEHQISQKLNEQCQQNDKLKREQLGLEKSVQSLQHERSCLQKELKEITSRRNDVEGDLSKANEECHRLSSELETFRASMKLLKSGHKQKQKNLEEALSMQLKELRTSVAILVEKDGFNEKRLSEYEAMTSKLNADAKLSQRKQQEQIQVEQRLVTDLNESRKTAQEEREASDLKLAELQKSIDALIVENESSKKIISDRKAELLKVKKDSKSTKKKLQAQLEKAEEQLLSKLKLSSERAREEKMMSDAKIKELRKSIEILVAKDESNKKLISDYETEMLNLQTDFEAAMLQAEAKHEMEQQKSRVITKLAIELNETREKVQEQEESSDLEIDEFRKSIDDLIAKDELELDMLRKSIDALAFKDELNQQLLSEREEEELRLKESAKTAMEEAKANFEREQRKSTAIEQQLLSDLQRSSAKTKNLELEKDALEQSIRDLRQDQFRLDKELDEANQRWEVAEAKVEKIDEEKRLLSADLTASRYSILRLESEQNRALVERDAIIKSHHLELAKQKSILSSSQEMKVRLQNELNIFRQKQRGLEQDKNDLENRLTKAAEVHDKFVQDHDVSLQQFQKRIEELKTNNSCLEKQSLVYQSDKSNLELRLGNLEQEYEVLQQTQNRTKIDLSQKSKEHEEFRRASNEKCKELESECDDLQLKVTSLHLEELNLQGKINTLVDRLERSRLKLEEQEKTQLKLDRLLSEERITVAGLKDDKEQLIRKTTSMTVEHTISLMEYEKKTRVAEAKVVEIEEECANLKADIALTSAAKATLIWKQKAVKEELTLLRKAHKKSEERIAKLLSIQRQSDIEYEKKITEMNNINTSLETQNKKNYLARGEMEDRLTTTTTLLDRCKCSLLKKETELMATKKMLEDLKQQQKLLIAENDTFANEKISMVEVHSKEIEAYESSLETLKKELENITSAVRFTKSENEELLKKSEEFDICRSILQEKCNETTLQLETAKKEKLLLQSIIQDQCRFTDSVLTQNEKYAESLKSMRTEKKELHCQLASVPSSMEKMNLHSTKGQESVEKLAIENSNLLSSLDEAKAIIATLTKEVDAVRTEKSSLHSTLAKAKEEMSGLQNENSVLKTDLNEANRLAANVRKEADKISKKNLSLNAKLEGAQETIATQISEALDVAHENSRAVATLTKDLNTKEDKISELQDKVNEATKETSVLNDSLNTAKEFILTQQTAAAKATKENSDSTATLKKELQSAKGTISTLQTETAQSAKENSCLIANLESDLQVAKGTISVLRKECDEARTQGSESQRAAKTLRSEVAIMEKALREMKLEREHIRSIGEDTTRSLQNDLANETNKTASIMKRMNIISQEKSELESRLKEAEEILAKTLEAQKARNELVQQECELETKSLQRQLDNAYSHSTHLGEVVSRLESEIKSTRDRITEQKYLRSLEETKVEQLKIELKEQTKTTKKLGKLLKRTMSSVTRVSRMKMDVDLCYYDTPANEYRQMPRKAEYSGGVIGSKPHGAGVMAFDCGDVYLGTFENGELSGEGSYIVAPHNEIVSKEEGKLHFKGLYDYNEIMRHRSQH